VLNLALVRNGLRQRLGHPIAMAILCLFGILGLAALYLNGGSDLTNIQLSFPAAFVLGAGIIGRDVRSGVLQLVLARPVTRSDYVISRWISVSACVAAYSLIMMLAGSLVLAAAGRPPAAGEIVGIALQVVFSSFGVVSVLLLLSSLLPGFMDIGAWLVLMLLTSVFQMIGEMKGMEVASRLAKELQDFLLPSLDLVDALSTSPPSWYAIVSYVSTVTICVAGALAVFNRKEISYASQ
jgi:ABC-type transport system involved in multi-copper enzyme maturation permease subunit